MSPWWRTPSCSPGLPVQDASLEQVFGVPSHDLTVGTVERESKFACTLPQ
jgi:hypothetical protein